MKTILRVFDFDIPTGDVTTNKGCFTNNQFNILLTRIDNLKKDYRKSFDVKEIKNGWIFYNFDPVKMMLDHE